MWYVPTLAYLWYLVRYVVESLNSNMAGTWRCILLLSCCEEREKRSQNNAEGGSAKTITACWHSTKYYPSPLFAEITPSAPCLPLTTQLPPSADGGGALCISPHTQVDLSPSEPFPIATVRPNGVPRSQDRPRTAIVRPTHRLRRLRTQMLPPT
jgi:hypothetical protein